MWMCRIARAMRAFADLARRGGKRSQADCAASRVKIARTSFSHGVTSHGCRFVFMRGTCDREADTNVVPQEACQCAIAPDARDRATRRGNISGGEIVSVDDCPAHARVAMRARRVAG